MNLTTFDFNDAPIRTMMREEQPWFVAADVCRVLDIANSRDAVSGLDEDERGVATTDTLGGQQKMQIISESGLYALVFKSRKPEAKTFRKWVTSEVLPALRQTGKYEVPVNVASWQPVRRTVRDQMMSLRELLISSAQAVQLKMLDVGRAQQVANLSARYLETIKLEGDAVGYETLFEMPAGEGGGGFLQAGRPDEGAAKPMQRMPQRSLRGTEAGEPSLPIPTVSGEETLGEPAPGGCGAASGEADFPERCAESLPGASAGAVDAATSDQREGEG